MMNAEYRDGLRVAILNWLLKHPAIDEVSVSRDAIGNDTVVLRVNVGGRTLAISQTFLGYEFDYMRSTVQMVHDRLDDAVSKLARKAATWAVKPPGPGAAWSNDNPVLTGRDQ